MTTSNVVSVSRHSTLAMTYIAITRGFSPENGGTFAMVKDESFSQFRIGLRKYVVT